MLHWALRIVYRFLLMRNRADAKLTNWPDTSKMQLFLHQVQVSKALNTMTIVSWIKLRFFDMRPANTS